MNNDSVSPNAKLVTNIVSFQATSSTKITDTKYFVFIFFWKQSNLSRRGRGMFQKEENNDFRGVASIFKRGGGGGGFQNIKIFLVRKKYRGGGAQKM